MDILKSLLKTQVEALASQMQGEEYIDFSKNNIEFKDYSGLYIYHEAFQDEPWCFTLMRDYGDSKDFQNVKTLLMHMGINKQPRNNMNETYEQESISMNFELQ